MDKLKMQSSNGVEDNITKIAQLFPDCVTETVDEKSGQPKHLIDFEKLKQNLSDSILSEKAERYQFTWPDKSKAILLANSPINATLRPCREESVDFDHTQNLYIEGDNLDVLKCLKETYLHKVKMIYIDPPYNTGNDFVYEDDFAQSSEEYLANSGQFDEQGNRITTNAESNGRFHTDWLNMIYPRLKVARDLLTDDGVIFISIDDNEVENLRKVCDEVFGEPNFESCVTWRRRTNQPNDKSKMIAKVAENIIVYAKNGEYLAKNKAFHGVPLTEERKKEYKNPDNDPNGPWSSNPWKAATGRGGTTYSITTPTGCTFTETWYGSKQTFESLIETGRVHWTDNGNGFPRIKIYLKDAEEEGQAAINFFTCDKYGSNQEGSAEIEALFNQKGIFDNPKPTKLLKSLLLLASNKDSIIVDFFSGSASTAHAVMQMNAEDGGNRKFIMVQLPENIDKILETANDKAKKTAQNAIKFLDSIGKPHTICEIGKERIRRAGKKIKEESPLTTQDLDTGFRVLKLDSTNMENIYYSPKDISQADLFSQVDNVKQDRTGEDLLFQVMLELGATLDSKIEKTEVAGKTIFNVAEGYLVACFDQDASDEVVKAIAQMQPAYAVLRDTSMKNDATATNFEQIFKTYSPDTVTRIL